MKKEEILDNVADISANDLVNYIRQGIVTLEELMKDTNGQFTATKRKQVEDLLKNGENNEWAEIKNKNTIEAYQNYLDSYPQGKFRNEARELMNELKKIEDEKIKEAEIKEKWDTIDKKNENEIKRFIKEYPNSVYIEEAKKLLNDLTYAKIMGVNIDSLINQIKQIPTNPNLVTQEQRDRKAVELIENFIKTENQAKEQFLDKIKEDNNLLSSTVVKSLIDADIISTDDLVNIGIDFGFIQKMYQGLRTPEFPQAEKLYKINKQSTEIYFWGIPSSGKSCALGAILSVASNGTVAKTMVQDTGSQGYGYMNRLINLFDTNDEIISLLAGTAITDFYEMGFDLIDNQNRSHPITCIDMAGELMRAMYKSNANESMSFTELEMLETLSNVLIDNKSKNRKIHFFVIEYGADNRLYEGLPQRTYLDGAVGYIRNTGIFQKDTDAIYIMVSKADKIQNPTKDSIRKYIEDKYKGFYNGLEQICKDNDINGGKVEIVAFTLGNVCFQSYCKFDSKAAENVVNQILARSVSEKRGKLADWLNIFRN